MSLIIPLLINKMSKHNDVFQSVYLNINCKFCMELCNNEQKIETQFEWLDAPKSIKKIFVYLSFIAEKFINLNKRIIF